MTEPLRQTTTKPALSTKPAADIKPALSIKPTAGIKPATASGGAETLDRFIPRAMSKAELAMLYLPDHEPHAAVTQLMRWVNACQPLLQELKEAGYNKHCKILQKRYVMLIVKHLDEP